MRVQRRHFDAIPHLAWPTGWCDAAITGTRYSGPHGWRVTFARTNPIWTTCPSQFAIAFLAVGRRLSVTARPRSPICRHPFYPFEGWTSFAVSGDYEAGSGVPVVTVDGVTDGGGCGESFYLYFVRFVTGPQVDPASESE